jgi:hypothetical protein
VVRTHGLSNPSIEATNSREAARDIVLPAVEEEQPKSAVVINCTAIAREVRRKLEAIGEG